MRMCDSSSDWHKPWGSRTDESHRRWERGRVRVSTSPAHWVWPSSCMRGGALASCSACQGPWLMTCRPCSVSQHPTGVTRAAAHLAGGTRDICILYMHARNLSQHATKAFPGALYFQGGKRWFLSCTCRLLRLPGPVYWFPACQAAVEEWFMTTRLQPVFTATSVLLQLTANEARHAFKQST